MVIVTTIGGLAATGLSYVSSMNSITTQRAELDRMWTTVHNLNSALASSGRRFRLNDPVSIGMRRVKNAILSAVGYLRKKRAQNIMKRQLNILSRRTIGPCDTSFSKRILEKQTPVVTNSDK